MTTVLVVDDHQLVRAGILALLHTTDDLDPVGDAADGERALALARSTRPDVVLMDLSMPVLDGVQATRRLLDELPGTKVVVLTSFSDQNRVGDALRAGAVGYLLKDSEPRELLAAVRAAADGHAPIDPRVARVLLPPLGGSNPATIPPAGVPPGGPAGGIPGQARLSDRERQVLLLVARGLANKQVGRALGITERTVKAHLGSIFRQIGVTDRTSAALWARDNIAPEPDWPPDR